jgi:hypothetical protein
VKGRRGSQFNRALIVAGVVVLAVLTALLLIFQGQLQATRNRTQLAIERLEEVVLTEKKTKAEIQVEIIHDQAVSLWRRVTQLEGFIQRKGLSLPAPAQPVRAPAPLPDASPAVPLPPRPSSPRITPGLGDVPLTPEPPPFSPPPIPTPEVTCVPFPEPVPDFCVEVPETPSP